jgi:hypothetical protein
VQHVDRPTQRRNLIVRQIRYLAGRMHRLARDHRSSPP